MTNKMRVAVFTGAKELELQERDIPVAGPNEMVIKVVACGICHTDEGYIEGTPTFKKKPLILGHEASGYIHQLGEGVDQFELNDAVLIPPVLTCGLCKYCTSNRSQICSKQQMLGNHIDGAFAEYIKVPAKDIIKIPDGLPVKELSIVADAIATPYHAVIERAKVLPGDKVVVIGTGGVGVNVVQFAAMLGAVVVAVDLQEEKLALAKEFGARYIVNPSKEENTRKKILSLIGPADVVFEVIGNPITQKLGLDLLGAGGKLMVVGYSPKLWDNFQSGKVMFRELDVMGSLGCPPSSFPRILELIQQGKIKVEQQITHRFPLEKINDAFEQLRKGDGVRVLVDIAD